MQLEIEAKVSSFEFCLKVLYDEREIENLLETLEQQGADYEHLGKGRYVLFIPGSMELLPFYQTVQTCPSVREVDYRAVAESSE